MKTIEKTLQILEQNINAITSFELVSLEEANDRFLAFDIYAKKNLPSFDNSALDGYAFNFDDKDMPLNVKGTIFAGDTKEYIVKKNECYKIMTGAKMPRNADTILMQEEAIFKDEKLLIKNELKRFNALRFKGEELKSGDLLLKKGELLTPAKIMLLASQGIYKVQVFRKIRIGIFSSGNELKEPWEKCEDTQIYNANALALKALFDKNAFECSYLGIIKDNFEETKNALKNAKFDLLLTSGGASVGEADFMQKALKELNFKTIFEGVKAKMAKPTKLYKKDEVFVLILPGNPLSAFISCFLFGIKLAFLLCSNLQNQTQIYAKMACEVKLKAKRNNFLLGDIKDGKFYPIQTSSFMINPLTKAKFLLITDLQTELLHEDEDIFVVNLS